MYMKSFHIYASSITRFYMGSGSIKTVFWCVSVVIVPKTNVVNLRFIFIEILVDTKGWLKFLSGGRCWRTCRFFVSLYRKPDGYFVFIFT